MLGRNEGEKGDQNGFKGMMTKKSPAFLSACSEVINTEDAEEEFLQAAPHPPRAPVQPVSPVSMLCVSSDAGGESVFVAP